MMKLIHNRNVSDVRLHDGEMKLWTHCTPGATKLFVAPDGTFYPCEKVDSSSHLIIGNLDEGVSIERMNALIRPFIDLKNKKCEHCIMQDICNVCIHSASDAHGCNEKKFDLLCDYARSDFKASLEMYCSILENDEDAFDFILNKSLTQKEETVL
jgi:radical SAM protein with 4Fe4S-binding SPASM domain